MNNYELTTEKLVKETNTYNIPANSLKEAIDMLYDENYRGAYLKYSDIDENTDGLFFDDFRILDNMGNILDEDGNVVDEDGNIIDEDGNIIE